MRYYVVSKSEIDGVAPHIIAEVVGDIGAEDPDEALASAFVDERRAIVTREELLEHPTGLEVLKAWEDEDDSAYDEECVASRARPMAIPRRGLRLVKTTRVL